MPKLTDKVGSGMTERVVVKYDRSEPGDVQALIQAAAATVERSSFARLVQRLTDLATRILVAASLPSDPERAYVVRPNGTWVVLDETIDLDAEQDSFLLPFDQAVQHLGHRLDAPESYAARVLRTLIHAQEQLQAGSMNEAMASAFAVGEIVNEAAMKGLFEPDFLRGEKVQEGARKGHRQAYGTPAERAAERQAHRTEFDRLRGQGHTKMKAYELAAAKFHVSSKTVQRAVQDQKDTG